MKVFELLEGAMPSGVIKHKEAMAQKTPEQMHKDFKEVSARTGKSVKDLALSAARRHGHGAGSTKYWDKIKHLEEDACRVCGQTPCNCTHITEGEAERKTNAIWAQITDYEKRAKATKDPIKKDHYMKMARELREKLPTNEGFAPQGGNYKQGKYHVVVAGKCISEHPNKSEASSAAAKYRKANPSSQPRVKHESELTEGLADEIADKALNDRLSKMSQEEKVKGGWAHPSTIKGPSAAERKKSRDYQRSATAKKARDAERRKGV